MSQANQQAQQAVLTVNPTQLHFYSAKKALVIDHRSPQWKKQYSIRVITHTNNPRAASISPPPTYYPTLLTDTDSLTAKMLHCYNASKQRRDSHFELLTTPSQHRSNKWVDNEHVLLPIASLLTISSTFNALFKVLCIFPSRYLFAIGLSPLFSFRRNLPPTLGCTPKQPDSLN